MRRNFTCLALAVAILGCRRSGDADVVANVQSNDREINAAMQKARDTFPDFWRVIADDRRRAIPAHAEAMVKAYFFDPETPDSGEHMWVGELEYDGKMISGTLKDKPEHVRVVKNGQVVRFPLDRLSDWLYIEDRKAVGAFTVKVLRARMTQEERRAHDSPYPFRFE